MYLVKLPIDLAPKGAIQCVGQEVAGRIVFVRSPIGNIFNMQTNMGCIHYHGNRSTLNGELIRTLNRALILIVTSTVRSLINKKYSNRVLPPVT